MKIGKQSIKLLNTPKILNTSSIVGPKEMKGPLAMYFETNIEDVKFNEKSFEKAESKLMKTCITNLITKIPINIESIDYIFAGDLLNQCIASSYCMRDLNIPYFGIYGACSSFCEALILGSIMVDSNNSKKVITTSSSHFCSAERQFRMPLEHGNQTSTTSQCTVTGAGSLIICSNEISSVSPYITYLTPGKIIDLKISDMSNMGAAMAPAAYDTIKTHLSDTKRKIDYYDLIITGDLGILGSDLLYEIFKKDGIDISNIHKDCGSIIYDLKNQDVKCGGSGAGCISSVFCSYFFEKLKSKEINKILLVATGALMSPLSCQQGESIPAIAHAVAIENEV